LSGMTELLLPLMITATIVVPRVEQAITAQMEVTLSREFNGTEEPGAIKERTSPTVLT
jgi:hypothetical protein